MKLGIEYIVEGLNEYFREGLRIIHEGGWDDGVTEASEVTASNSDRSQGKKVFRKKSSKPGLKSVCRTQPLGRY